MVTDGRVGSYIQRNRYVLGKRHPSASLQGQAEGFLLSSITNSANLSCVLTIMRFRRRPGFTSRKAYL
jgi:hypothetical protein